MIPQAIAVMNGKGGVYKTSVAANVAGLVAAADYKVLVADLDPDGTLAREFGVKHDSRFDDGRELATAMLDGRPAIPVKEVRPNLDFLCGGIELESMLDQLVAGRHASSPAKALLGSVAPLAESYNLIIFDTPPRSPHLQDMVLTSSRFVIVPTMADDGSLDGLERLATRFDGVRQTTNASLELLGIVLVGLGVSSRRLLRDARATIARDFGSEEALFDTFIRGALAAAVMARKRGKLVHELEGDVDADRRRRFQALAARRNKEVPQSEVEPPASVPESTRGLAEDYQNLTVEVTNRLTVALRGAA